MPRYELLPGAYIAPTPGGAYMATQVPDDDPARRLLEIEFPDGSVYQYERVPPELHRRFLAATSKRSFFDDNIEEVFTRRRV